MKNLSILFLLLFIVISCNKKEVKKESKEYKEPVVEQPIINDEKVDDENEKVNEEVSYNNSKTIFTVQIAALRNNNENLRSLNDVKTYEENSLTKYRLGNFDTYKAARNFRNQIKNTYKGAFVQAIKNNEPISITEALKE
jgi:hypothetical protein